MKIDIPGWKTLTLEHAFFDVNGTLAELGEISEETVEKVRKLSEKLTIHLVTSDTRGKGRAIAERLGAQVEILDASENAIEAKRRILHTLGADRTVVFGNGANDAGALQDAAIGIAILSPNEGAASSALLASDAVVPSIETGLDLLLDPLRLIATLRR